MSLDELKSRGKSFQMLTREKRERLGGELINEVSEMENDDEVVDETVEEVMNLAMMVSALTNTNRVV